MPGLLNELRFFSLAVMSTFFSIQIQTSGGNLVTIMVVRRTGLIKSLWLCSEFSLKAKQQISLS